MLWSGGIAVVPAGSHLFSGYSQRGFAQDMFKQLMAIREMFNLQESGPPGRQVLGCSWVWERGRWRGPWGQGTRGVQGLHLRAWQSRCGHCKYQKGSCGKRKGAPGITRVQQGWAKRPQKGCPKSGGTRSTRVRPAGPGAAGLKVVQIKLSGCAALAPQPLPEGTESQTENRLIPRSDPSLP